MTIKIVVEGPQGPVGAEGPQGEIGPQGPIGETGPQGAGASTAAEVEFPTDGEADAIPTFAEFINNVWSAGVVCECPATFTITKNVDGTLSVPAADVMLRDANLDNAPLQLYHVSANASLALTDLVVNFVYANYNSGSPVWAVDTSILNVNGRNKMLVAIAFRNGTSVDLLTVTGLNVDVPTKRARRLFNVNGMQYGSGLIIGGTDRLITFTEGVLYFVDKLISVSAYDSQSTAFTYIYRNGTGGYTRVSANQIDNEHFDNGTGTLAHFSNQNKWRADYVYAIVDEPTRFIVVMGRAEYQSEAAAQATQPPTTLPPELATYGLGKLVARVVIQANASTMVRESPFLVKFLAVEV